MPPHMHRGDINDQAGRNPRKIQPVNVRPIDLFARIEHQPPRPIIIPHLGVLHARRLLLQRLLRPLVQLPRRRPDPHPQIRHHVQADAAAEEDGAFEGQRLARPLQLMVQQETADQARALREAHHAVVGALSFEDFGEPGVRGADRGHGGAVPEGVVGGRVEDVDAGGGGGGEGRVDEVEGVG